MANFHTHLNVAAVSAGGASATLLCAGHIGLGSFVWLWFIGTIGGLLPDIDSDNSTSLNSLFRLFTFALLMLVLHHHTSNQYHDIRLLELLIIPPIVYGLSKYLLRPLLEKITVHRGQCHSLSFLLLCALITTQVTDRMGSIVDINGDTMALLTGAFLFIGGFIHLLLDEICSVDLANTRIKRSFGSALKIADFNNKWLTLVTFLGILVLVYISPSTVETINTLSNWSKLKLY